MGEPAADAGLAAALLGWVAEFDAARHLTRDPVRFARRFSRREDQEVVGLLAALLAYGRVDLIGRALTDVLARVGDAPAAACVADDEEGARRRFDGFVYRLTRGEDVARVWLGCGALLRAFGGLGAAFAAGDDGGADLRGALSAFREALLAPTAHWPPRQALEHLAPDPRRGSACKRWNLFLRWMVRPADGVDLGLWTDVAPHRLTIPLDTHVHRLSRYLGLTARRAADWRTAAEITAALRTIDPADPLRFDFALAHLGISGECPSRRVPSICAGCPIRQVCRLDADGAVTPAGHHAIQSPWKP